MKPKQYILKELIELYNKTSKHSNYQILPSQLRRYIQTADFHVRSRYEEERLAYLKEKVSFENAVVIDVGGNTGFFTFEALNLGASLVKYFEGNPDHVEFVRKAAILTGMEDKIEIHNTYIQFDDFREKSEIILLLNVLHHLGDDFGDPSISMLDAKNKIINYLNQLAKYHHLMIFQMGFCWKGNIQYILFDHGTKAEMIDFIKNGTRFAWEILHIGVAEKIGNQILYRDLNEKNIARDDSLGEFLNRPIFILESKLI